MKSLEIGFPARVTTPPEEFCHGGSEEGESHMYYIYLILV